MPFPPFFVTECLEIGRTPGGCPADPGREACCQPRGLLGGRGAGLRVPWRPGPGRHACRPPLCHSRSQGLRLRLTKPQHKGTQNKASQNLEWPSFPGWRTPGLKGLPSFCLKGLQAPAEAETLRRRRSAHRGAWPLRAPPRQPPPRPGVSFAARVRPGGFFSGRPGSSSPVSPPGREAFEGRRPGASSLHCEVRRLFGR